jgi:hypothetical protein
MLRLERAVRLRAPVITRRPELSRTFYNRGLLAAVIVGLLAMGCSGDSDRTDGTGGPGPGDPDADGGDDGGRGIDNPDPTDVLDGGFDGGPQDLELRLSPEGATLRVTRGDDLPTLQFEVTNHGRVVPAAFRVENGELGRIDDDGLFTPSGDQGGTTVIEARVGARVLHTALTIELEWIQNGTDPDHPVETSSGGYGGVGGEGPGGPVSDELRETLDGEPIDDAAMAWLYPYDKTVFPLDLLAPLLMWTPGEVTAAEGITLHLYGSNFEYRGYFARPALLATDADFVRHPIPQEVWEGATKTVAGGQLHVELSLAKDGKVYGPIKQSWKIARGSLKGTVYYQSYGTHLAKNHGGAIGGDGRFGGATLAIKPGAIEPELVAGGDGGEDQCRVCHSVSSDGSRMTVQHGGDNDTTSSYDLLNANMETVYAPELRSQLAWIGMTPDGAFGLSNGQPMSVGGDPVTALRDMESGDVVPTMGLDLVREAAFPAFAHDGRKVAFNFWNGTGDATIGMGDAKKLVAMDFDPMMRVFDNAQLLYEGEQAAGWPSFSPTGTGVIFQVEVERGNSFFETRYGAKGELWWTNLRTGDAHRLDRVNGVEDGTAYLPKSDSNHDADEQLNYEPTVAPIASGGYAWVVFTSRRLYGNVATIDPWFSDPREHDLTSVPTTKKLWVAAIELDVDTPELDVNVGPDPSHPAFYLPGQELLAGNARGFWVVDPCKAEGASCESGVECCAGYCQEDEDGELTCGRKTDECSEEFDRCDTAADCCDPGAACVNHVCTMLTVD